MNNILDLSNEDNQRFLASVVAVLCEQSPLTIDLTNIEKFYNGEIVRLKYVIDANVEERFGSITFSLKEKTDADNQSQDSQDN